MQVASTASDKRCVVCSEGFQTAPLLARKVVHVLRAAEQLLTRQPTYDFGMRALKSILLAAGAALRCSISKNDLIDVNSLDVQADRQRAELQEINSFVHTLRDMLLPKLTSDDTLIVEGIIQVLLSFFLPQLLAPLLVLLFWFRVLPQFIDFRYSRRLLLPHAQDPVRMSTLFHCLPDTRI
jgi:hypothetical protein